MSTALWIFAGLGLLGGFDTLWFHEWRARLPARADVVRRELEIHALRSAVYAILFATLPWMRWQGAWAVVLAVLLLAEIALTLSDFVVEDRVRASLGGVFPGERVTHAVMGIVYGAFLAFLVPVLLEWVTAPTRLALAPAPVAPFLRVFLSLLAVGVLASAVRDALASRGVRWAAWPLRPIATEEPARP